MASVTHLHAPCPPSGRAVPPPRHFSLFEILALPSVLSPLPVSVATLCFSEGALGPCPHLHVSLVCSIAMWLLMSAEQSLFFKILRVNKVSGIQKNKRVTLTRKTIEFSQGLFSILCITRVGRRSRAHFIHSGQESSSQGQLLLLSHSVFCGRLSNSPEVTQ